MALIEPLGLTRVCPFFMLHLKNIAIPMPIATAIPSVNIVVADNATELDAVISSVSAASATPLNAMAKMVKAAITADAVPVIQFVFIFFYITP
jgi:hypothetical protein